MKKNGSEKANGRPLLFCAAHEPRFQSHPAQRVILKSDTKHGIFTGQKAPHGCSPDLCERVTKKRERVPPHA